MHRQPIFARLLRNARKSAGLSVAELARRADLSREAVRLIEAGKRTDPTWATVQALAHALDLPTDFFVTAPKSGAKTTTKGD
jgi:transcriptional regulator with XRE-family HTH domain